LKRKFGAETTLVESSGGVFEVEMDGRLIFSKKSLGRFPEDGEIAGLAGA
jgi:selenoprotein W-related protein